MLHFPSMQAPFGGLRSARPRPFGHLQSRTGWAGVAHTRFKSAVPFPGAVRGLPRKRRNLVSSRAAAAAPQDAPNTLATSTFSPGPMVEDSDTRLM